MAKHFKNLKILKLDNTSLLEKLKANELIESVSLLNSNILSVNSFKKKVPEPLLTRNNMANYTQVKLNGVLLSESEIAKLKLGKMNVEHNDKIEVMDGVLAGAIFTIILGTPLNELIKDSVLLTHIKELLNKESTSSLVSLYELQTITWIGKNPDEVTELNYLGYFNTKTIGNMETFKNDLKQLPNLKYINLAGAIFTTDLNLNDFNLTNFKYSFANCTVLQNVTIDKTIVDLEGTFRNCQNLRTVTIGENANLSNMIKTFYGCKGILNFTINNPNMTDTDNVNVFEESLISTLNFIKEPFNNIITSNLLKHAIYSSSTLNLDNKNRPDLYNLTFTANANLEKLTLNNTNIEEIDLTKATTNFTNLKYLEANNTNKLQNFKLNGNNLTSISFTNSSILIQKIKDDETPKIFTENKDYYSRVSVNDIELTEVEVIKLKNGNYKFNHADVIKFLNGPLINISFEITNGIIPTVILELFPDPTLAEYIRIKTNKSTINDIVSQNELNTIIYFGYDGLQTTSTVTSWFKEKTVNSWVGTEHLKNIQNVYLNGVLGTANEIIISSKEIKTLSYAFNGCTALTSITLPSELPGLTNLSYAFYRCTGLSSITLPKKLPNLTNVSNYNNVFNNCNLDEVYIPLSKTGFGNSSSNLFQNCNIKKIIVREPDIGDIDPIDLSYMCKDSISTSIILECQGTSNENLTNLSNTFQNCTALTSITLPNELPSLTNLSDAFYGCRTLTSITLPNELPSLTTLYYAFQNCTALTSITLPNELPSLTNLSDAFYGCRTLTSITLPNQLPNLTTLSYAFNGCTALTSITLPNELPNLTTLSYAFNGCTALTSITLPNELPSLTNLSNTFQNCSVLTSITLPNELPSLTTLYYAFYGCRTLTSITLPNELPSLTNLSYAFYGCRTLTSITLPNELPSLTTLYYAFYDCTALTSITLPNKLPSLNSLSDAFNGCTALTLITLPSELPSLTTLSNTFNGCSALTSITLPNELPSLTTLSNTFRSCPSLTSVTLPNELPSLTTLSYAFNGCSALTSVFLPPIIPKLTTSLGSTYLESSNRTYIYHANQEVDDIQKITLHPNLGTKDYSKLTNLLTFDQAFLDDILSEYICSKLSLNTNSPMDSSKLLTLIELTNFPNGINNFEGLKYCKNLEYVSFKNNVNYRVINLKHCFNLKRLNESFSGCINLENLELPDNLENIVDCRNVIFNCPKISRLCIPNIKNEKSLNLILKELDIENKTLELKGNLNRFDNFNIIKNIIKANIIFSNEIYNKPLDFYFKPKLKEIIKEKLALTEENPNITKSQLDTITELVLNTELEGGLELAILTNLTTLTINKSLNLLNLKYTKNIDNITFNNCIKLKELFLPINNNCVKDINLTITGTNNLIEIYTNKGINLDYLEFKKIL